MKNQERKSKKHKNTKKNSFSVISQNFLFLTGYPKIAFLTPWPRKRAPKNTIKIGVSAYFFGKKVMRHETAIFRQKKKPNSEIPVIIFFCLFSISKTKTQKSAETPIFIVFWQT